MKTTTQKACKSFILLLAVAALSACSGATDNASEPLPDPPTDCVQMVLTPDWVDSVKGCKEIPPYAGEGRLFCCPKHTVDL